MTAAGTRAPWVSVIIPCYNTAAFVGETLASLFAQTFTDFEAIVVNDGSPDTEALERVLAPYRERIRYVRQENRGLAGARNAGLQLARGSYIALLDSDDVWEPEYLRVHVAALESDASLDVYFCDALNFGDTPLAGKTCMEHTPLEGPITWRRLVAQECYVWGGVMMRAETVRALGGFDESLHSSEDYDLWLRILRAGGRIGYGRQVLARYRRRGTSLSADLERMFAHHLKVWDKLAQTEGLDAGEQALVAAQRRRTIGALELERGRAALLAGDSAAALRALREANRHLRRPKLALVIAAVRIAPSLLRRLHGLRGGNALRPAAHG